MAGYSARFELPDGGKTMRPLILKNGRWHSKGLPSPRPLYQLPALAERPDAPVLVVEGEKTCDAARQVFPDYIAITSIFGANASHRSDWSPLRGRRVTIWPDNDENGFKYAREVAAHAFRYGAASVSLVQLPEALPRGWDLADPVPGGVNLEWLITEVEAFAPSAEGSAVEEKEEVHGTGLSLADRLLRQAKLEVRDLYADGDDTYADVLSNGIRESWPVRSRDFRRWLRMLCYDTWTKGATQDVVNHVEANLDAQAARAHQRKVHLRSASYQGKLYVDVGDKSRHVAEIGTEGWRVLTDPPVRFRRPATSQPLALPVRTSTGEGIQELKRFLNMSNGDFVLCVAWLLAALRDVGPFPVLILSGQQGSAKSTTARLLRALVDPAKAPSRGMPRDERDGVIAARNRHVMVYDNLSGLPVWFSDYLCRLSTGEGFATRALHTDDEEVVFEAIKPVILTGIDNLAVRGDLADRSLIIGLNPIPDADRRTEGELMANFEEARHRIFGALLDGLVEGLRQLPSVRLEQLPRMADFCAWAVACEGAFWPPGTFLAALDAAHASSSEDLLDQWVIWPELHRLLDVSSRFEGTANELLQRLNEHTHDRKAGKGWPATGAVLGRQLARMAPALRKFGYVALRVKTNRGNQWRISALE